MKLDNYNINDLWERKRPLEATLKAVNSAIEVQQKLSTDDKELLDREGLLAIADAVQIRVTKLEDEIHQRRSNKEPYVRVYIDYSQYGLETKLRSARGKIKSGYEQIKVRRQKMRDTGSIPEADILKYAPDFNPATIEQEIAEIEADRAAWQKFEDSGLLSDLPSNAEELLPQFPVRSGNKEVKTYWK